MSSGPPPRSPPSSQRFAVTSRRDATSEDWPAESKPAFIPSDEPVFALARYDASAFALASQHVKFGWLAESKPGTAISLMKTASANATARQSSLSPCASEDWLAKPKPAFAPSDEPVFALVRYDAAAFVLASRRAKAGAGGETRTHTTFYGPRILSPVRLPFRHTGNRLFTNT